MFGNPVAYLKVDQVAWYTVKVEIGSVFAERGTGAIVAGTCFAICKGVVGINIPAAFLVAGFCFHTIVILAADVGILTDVVNRIDSDILDAIVGTAIKAGNSCAKTGYRFPFKTGFTHFCLFRLQISIAAIGVK